MADIADITQARQEAIDSLWRKSHDSRSSNRELEPRGKCYECETKLTKKKLFCDKECSDMYEQRKEARRRAGN